MAMFGTLDEIRHGQIQPYFAYELVAKEPQYDWAHKAYHTNEWGIIAARALFDDMCSAPNVVDLAIQLPLTSRPASPTCSSSEWPRTRWVSATSTSLT